MTGPCPRGARRGPLASIALLAVLLTMVAPAAAIGPWIEVTSHTDGQFLTTKLVTVSGTVTEPTNVLTLSGEDLVNATMANVRLVNDKLTFTPACVFQDHFGGNTLDTQKWTIVRDPDNVFIEDGALKIDYPWSYVAHSPASNMTMVKSTAFEVPDDVDYEVSYSMKFFTASMSRYSGAGGGVSDGPVDPWESHLAILWRYIQQVDSIYGHVIADGVKIYNITVSDSPFSDVYHDYGIDYHAREDRFECYRDGESLGRYQMNTTPNMFWFGHTDDEGSYPYRPDMMVDDVSVWATSGEWLSDIIDMGHHVELESAGLSRDSNYGERGETLLEVRASEDEADWTDWVTVDGKGQLERPLNGTYLQLRMRLAIPGVYDESAYVRVTAIDLRYRDPLVSVEVRSPVTDWMPVEGLHDWEAEVELVENENTVEVRATDTAGNVNVSSLLLVVDTTPPVGTLAISEDQEYTNDLNVTLLLNATDRYGVDWVEASHSPDFSQKVRYPYSDQVKWRMADLEGETFVYVRYVDGHGLISEVLSASIRYDPFPPTARVLIAAGAEWTSTDLVRLDLEYSDNVGVQLVELSNHADFTDIHEVTGGETVVEDWRLAEGGDGPRAVHIRVTDLAGNHVTGSDAIKLYFPKQEGTVSINDGEELTGQSSVRLSIDVPFEARINQMQVSNEPTFANDEWRPLESDIMWVLPEGDGLKTVHVRFKDYRDIATVPINDSIVLDQTAPVLKVTLNDGRPYTTEVVVSGTVTYQDAHDPVRMWVSMDEDFAGVEPVEFSGSFQLTIPAQEAHHTIHVRVEDAAGNLGTGNGTVHYATIRPQIVLELPGGDVIQTVPSINVKVTPLDPYGGIEVQVAFDDRPGEDASWIPLSGPVDVEVPEGVTDGVHTIWVRARNAAGLTTEDAVPIQVTFDNAAPTLAILYPEDGSKVTQKDLVVRLEVDVSDSSRLDRLVYVVDGGDPLNISRLDAGVEVVLEDWGEHTIEVIAEDGAGNVATSTSVFTLVDASKTSTGTSTGLLVIALLAIVGAAIVVAYRFKAGQRPADIHDGDNLEEEDHAELESLDEERGPSDLQDSPEDPLDPDREATEMGTSTPATGEPEGVELEPVDIPRELIDMTAGDGERDEG